MLNILLVLIGFPTSGIVSCSIPEPFAQIDFQIWKTNDGGLPWVWIKSNYGNYTKKCTFNGDEYRDIRPQFPSTALLEKVKSTNYIPIGTHHNCFGSLELCTDGFTMSFWLKINPKSAENVQNIFNTGISNAQNILRVQLLKNDDQFHLVVSLTNKVPETISSAITNLSKTEWLYLSLSYHPGSKILSMYKNGERTNSMKTSFTFTSPISTISENFILQHFIGSIDDLFFWNRELSEDQIKESYLNYFRSSTCSSYEFKILGICSKFLEWFDSSILTCKKSNKNWSVLCSGILKKSELNLNIIYKNHISRETCEDQAIIIQTNGSGYKQCKMSSTAHGRGFTRCSYICECHEYLCKIIIGHHKTLPTICEINSN